MSLSSSTNKALFGVTSATNFPFAFKVFAESDLIVLRVDSAGVETTVSPSLYTVNGVGADSGSIDYPTHSSTDLSLTILREVDETQPTVLRGQSTFYADVVEKALDRIVMICQQIMEVVSRSIHLPRSITGVSLELPTPIALDVLAWNADATALTNINLSALSTAYQLAYGRLNTTATAGQTVFTVPAYTIGINGLLVWLNGALLVPGTDYTETSTTSITLLIGATVGDQMSFLAGTPVTGTSVTGDQVTYLAPYTGAVARTQAAKNTESISILDFSGVDPTKATGSAAGIQAAINSGAREIIIPKGDYLIDADLVAPAGSGATNRVSIRFQKGATFWASSNGRTFFKSASFAFGFQVYNARLNGNGKTGVVGFDMSSMRLDSGIFDAHMELMDTGFIGRQGCFGLLIQNPTCYGVTNPIILIANNSGVLIHNPVFDNSVGAGGTGAGTGVSIQYGAGSNLGARIIGGYIQGFANGILDDSIGTVVEDTYFEACTTADVSATSNARNGKYRSLEHWGATGAAAYKLRNTDAMTIFAPTMGNSARTVLYDIDSTNSNCVEYRPNSNASYNVPTGSLTYVNSLPVQTTGSFTPAVTGSGGGTATISTASGKYTRTGNTVAFELTATWTAFPGMAGAVVITGLPAGLAPISFTPQRRFSAFPQFAFTGPIAGAGFNGAGTTITLRQLSVAGGETLIPVQATGTVEVCGTYEIN